MKLLQQTRLRNSPVAIAVVLALFGAAAVPAHAAVIPAGDVLITPTAYFVGNTGAGQLTVNQGSGLVTNQLIAGLAAGSNGAVTINGVGSSVQVSQQSIIGSAGTGSLQITGGGNFTSTFGVANQSALTVGSSGAGNGSVSVSGNGSQLAANGIVTLGLGPVGNPTGALTITDGGRVNAVALQSAFNAGASSNVLVSGPGSTLRLSSFSAQPTFLNVGRVGTGVLDVTSGGKILMDPSAANVGLTAFNALNIGGSGGGNPPPGVGSSVGTVNVSGAGSEIRQKGDFSTVGVGRNGTGTLNISNGGQVVTENLTGATFSAIGRASGANGTALVDGAGSLWQVGNKLFIGTELTANTTGGTEAVGGGTGTLTVSNGGKVVAGSQVIVGAGGTIKGGGGTIEGSIVNKGTIAPGNSPGILTVIGDLILTALGRLNIELGGTSNANTSSPQYDQIKVFDNPLSASQEGRIEVDGAVNVAFLAGYDAHAGDFFDILSGLDITQLNPLYNLPTLQAGLSWDIREITMADGREVLRLMVAGPAGAVPEPGVFALLGIGLFGLGFARRQRR